jgi:APA family basic amino acid/polyamine antiporter
VLATISRRNVPIFTIIISGVVISGIVLLTGGNLDWLASIFNFGTLLTFFFINLSLLQLRRTMPDVKRSFLVPFYPFTPILALISCIALAFYLNVNAILTACAFLAAGIVVYYLTTRKGPGRRSAA